MIRRWLFVLAAPLLAQQIPLDRLKPLFDYDASRPLEARTDFIRQEPGAKISELTYASPMGGRVDAYLVEPATPARRRPAIVFGHWGRAVSLIINYPWKRPDESRRVFRCENGQKDVDTARQAVLDLRRAIDVLAARPDVDPNRIPYVGHSYGAQWGAILSAVDRRMKACFLIGGLGA